MGKIYQALERSESSNIQAQEQKFAPQYNVSPSKELVVLDRPGSIAAEKFRFLRSKITRSRECAGKKTFLITSPLQGEGKTFIAGNLAVTVSQGLDEHVLLVDADLRKPKLHQLFGLNGIEKGLSTYLMDQDPLENLLCKTGIEKLTVLPAGMSTTNPLELLASQKMSQLITEVKERYPDRLVIFDSPPIELAPESLVLASEVDGVFLVLKRASTPRDIVQSTLDKIDQKRFHGIIFNYDKKPSKYYKQYKNDKYGYGYSYSCTYQT